MSNFSASTPLDLSKAFVGMDTSFNAGGKRDQNLWEKAKKLGPNFAATLKPTPFTPSFEQTPSTTPVQDLTDQQRQQIALEKEFTPIWLERLRATGREQAALSAEQLAQVYPYMTAARSRATAEDLAASQAYRRFAEGLPSNVQNIMASKQSQIQSAQIGEAALQEAVARQLFAAKESQGRFAGQYVQFG